MQSQPFLGLFVGAIMELGVNAAVAQGLKQAAFDIFRKLSPMNIDMGHSAHGPRLPDDSKASKHEEYRILLSAALTWQPAASIFTA